LTFTDICANQNNFIRVKIPCPPIEPACLKVDRICSSCRKTEHLTGYWGYSDELHPPTPYPPEKVLNLFIFNPVVTELYTFYSEQDKELFISVLYFFKLRVIYLDQKNNRGLVDLSHRGETATWLESPPGTAATTAILGEVLFYELKKQDLCQKLLKDMKYNITLWYTIGLTFDFLSIQKVKVLVPTFGPCIPIAKCPSPEFLLDK
jgi:hypothetical protein